MSKVDTFLANLEKNASTSEVTEEQANAYFEKLSAQDETIEASTTLAIAGSSLLKLAEESKDELLEECGNGLMNASQSLMIGLNKIAAEDVAGTITDMVETQDGLQKIAEVLNHISEESKNEEFTKLANSVIEVNNTLFDELAELAEKDPSVAEYIKKYHTAE